MKLHQLFEALPEPDDPHTEEYDVAVVALDEMEERYEELLTGKVTIDHTRKRIILE